MAYNLTRVALFGVIGLILATSIILTVEYLPFIPVVEAKGMLIIKVKDARAELEELYLKIDGVRVHRKGDDEGTWIDMEVVPSLIQPFDLLKLTDYATVLAVDELPAGDFTEIRLHVISANATIDGEGIPLQVVANGWLKVKVHFTLEEESVTILVIDIDVNENSIVHSKKLNPVVKVTVEQVSASSPVQEHYWWAEDDDEESPTLSSSQDDPIVDVPLSGAVFRMRLSVKNEGAAVWSGVKLKLQYSIDKSGWFDVDVQGGTGIWRYYDGLGTDKVKVGNLLLGGSTIKEHFVESSPTKPITKIPIGGQGEWDICIESNDADAGETYYFRFVLSDETLLDAYSEYPTLTTSS